MASLAGKRHVERNDVSAGQQLFKCHQAHARCFGYIGRGVRVGSDHFETKRLSFSRYSLSDLSESDYPEDVVAKLPDWKHLQLNARDPIPPPSHSVRQSDLAHHREHKSKRVVRHF